MEFCPVNQYTVLNTIFNKDAKQLAAFRENTTRIGETITAENHAQIDYILVNPVTP